MAEVLFTLEAKHIVVTVGFRDGLIKVVEDTLDCSSFFFVAQNDKRGGHTYTVLPTNQVKYVTPLYSIPVVEPPLPVY